MQKGLTQAQLSQSLGMERTMIAKIESGQRKVTALELASLAHELGRRLEWFVMPRPASVTQYRSGEPNADVSEIDVVAEQAIADVELLRELGHLDVPHRPTVAERPTSADATEILAQRVRTMAGMEAAQPVADLSVSAWTLGLVAFAEPLDGGADGASITNDDWGVAIINSTHKLGRRRLALAHELCHFVIGDRYVQDFRIDQPAAADQHEARMDRFARAFLMPGDAVQQMWHGLLPHGLRHAAVVMASTFRVDMSTLAKRLHQDLSLITQAQADDVRTVRTNRADIIENDLYVPSDLEGVALAPDFVRGVLRAYRADDISASRALSLLRGTFQASDLPALAPVDEGALWSLTR